MHRIVRLALTLAVLSVSALHADTLVVAKHHSDAVEMMGQKQPAKDHTIETWIAKGKIARWAPDTSVLIDTEASKMLVVDHAAKTYQSISLPLDFKAMMPPEMAAMMEQMGKMMTWSATVTPTGESKTVAGYNTSGYKVAITGPMGMQIDQTTWATKDLEIDYASIKELMMNQRALMAPFAGDWWKKLSAIDGYPLLTEATTSMGGKSWSTREEVLSVETKAAPASAWAPPAGYAEKPFDPMGQGRRKG